MVWELGFSGLGFSRVLGYVMIWGLGLQGRWVEDLGVDCVGAPKIGWLSEIWEFPKIRGTLFYFGVLIVRILLCGVVS